MFALFSCKSVRHDVDGNDLFAEGFLKYVPFDKIEVLKADLINEFDIYQEDTFSFFSIDAEEVA